MLLLGNNSGGIGDARGGDERVNVGGPLPLEKGADRRPGGKRGRLFVVVVIVRGRGGEVFVVAGVGGRGGGWVCFLFLLFEREEVEVERESFAASMPLTLLFFTLFPLRSLLSLLKKQEDKGFAPSFLSSMRERRETEEKDKRREKCGERGEQTVTRNEIHSRVDEFALSSSLRALCFSLRLSLSRSLSLVAPGTDTDGLGGARMQGSGMVARAVDRARAREREEREKALLQIE